MVLEIYGRSDVMASRSHAMGDRDRLALMTCCQIAVLVEVRDPVYLIDFIDQKVDGWGTWIRTRTNGVRVRA
jgi:hypothetical protein